MTVPREDREYIMRIDRSLKYHGCVCHDPTACYKVARGAKPQYSGMMDCAKQLFKTGGMRSVFKGWEATLLRDVPGYVLYIDVLTEIKGQG